MYTVYRARAVEMSTSQSDPGLPPAIDQQNKKFTTIIIYPTGEILMKNPETGKHNNHMQTLGALCCFSDAGEDNHTHGVVHSGLPAVSPHGNMLLEAEGQISEGSGSSEKFGVSAHLLYYYYVLCVPAVLCIPKTLKSKQR